MVEIGLGYAPKGGCRSYCWCCNWSAGGASAVSGFIKIDPMDGLEIGFGVGEVAATATGHDNSYKLMIIQLSYVTYVYGPLTLGYQETDIETYTAAES